MLHSTQLCAGLSWQLLSLQIAQPLSSLKHCVCLFLQAWPVQCAVAATMPGVSTPVQPDEQLALEQLAHISAPSLVQAPPAAAVPPAQVHVGYAGHEETHMLAFK